MCTQFILPRRIFRNCSNKPRTESMSCLLGERSQSPGWFLASNCLTRNGLEVGTTTSKPLVIVEKTQSTGSVGEKVLYF